jgi:hypothetical protein
MNCSKRGHASGCNSISLARGIFAMSDYYVTMRSAGEPLVNFRFGGGPIDAFEANNRLFAAIGYAATAWSRFEQHLDAILIHVNADAHSEEIFNPEHPITFNQKIKLLKRWFNQHPSLAHISKDMRRITSTAKELSRMRNQFLHSVLEDWDTEKQRARFHECKWIGNNEWQATPVYWTIDGLTEFATNVNLGNKVLDASLSNDRCVLVSL